MDIAATIVGPITSFLSTCPAYHHVWCLLYRPDPGGEREQSLALAKESVEEAGAAGLDLILAYNGFLRARVLRLVGGPEQEAELEAQIEDSHQLLVDGNFGGFLPHALLERAALSRRRGEPDRMARDFAEAQRLFAAMNASGWEAYATSLLG